MAKTPKGMIINLDNSAALRGRKVPPGYGQLSRGLDDAIGSEPGSLNENARMDRPAVSSARNQSNTRSERFWTGNSSPTPGGMNGDGRGATLETMLQGSKAPTNDSPVPMTGRQMPNPADRSKSAEVAHADPSQGLGARPTGVLGGS